MKYFEPNVVIIDDRKDEVSGLIAHYQESGTGCKFFNANPFNGDDHPEKKMADVTLLFLDLYYTSGIEGLDPEQPAGWVRDIIPPGSFYILILWTKDPAEKSAVIEILEKHNTKPYLVFTERKGDYANNSSDKYDYSRLINSINNKISEVPAFDEIMIWKNTLKRTSNAILGGLLGEEHEEFTNKLKRIIKEHGGKMILSIPKEETMKKRSILFEALNNVLISNTPQYSTETEISKENINGLYNISGKENVPVDRKLNSWFHFILKNDLNKMISPGIIAKNNSSLLKKIYSIQDDKRIENLLSPQKKKNVLIEDIVINITRPCDYAQNKYGKNIKLLSGVAIKKPERTEDNNILLGGMKDKLPDCIKIFDHLYYDNENEDLTLLFDFRYSFSIPENVFQNRFENIKMLTKELLSEIQVSYSSYTSRLGYTKFL